MSCDADGLRRAAPVIEPLLMHLPGSLEGLPIPMHLAINMRSVSNDPKLSKVIATDPRSGGSAMPAGFLRTFLSSEPLLDVCPVLLTHPGDDRWTDIAISRPFFDRLKVPKQLVTLGSWLLPDRAARRELATCRAPRLSRAAKPRAKPPADGDASPGRFRNLRRFERIAPQEVFKMDKAERCRDEAVAALELSAFANEKESKMVFLIIAKGWLGLAKLVSSQTALSRAGSLSPETASAHHRSAAPHS
jgi:hypothetical protein